MKKHLPMAIILLLAGLLTQAQNLNLLMGEAPAEPIVYADFVEWSKDDSGKIAAWYHDFGNGKYAIWANNPEKTGINSTSRSLMIKSKTAPDWWGNFFNFRLDAPIAITEDNRYLHILHYRENLTDGWSFSINANEPLGNDDVGKLRFDGNNNQAGVWEDIVIDLNHLITNNVTLEKIMLIVDKNWDGNNSANVPTEYYFDEITLSADPTPRSAPDKSQVLLSGEPASELITYYNFAEWTISDAGKIPAWYHDFGDGKYVAWESNPDMTGTNTSDFSLHIKTTTAPDWWGNFFNFRLETPLNLTEETRYLHFYHFRENLTDGWSVSINANEPLDGGAVGTLRFDGNNAAASVWEDIVIDLNHLITNNIPFEKFMLIVDKNWDGNSANNPPSKYYFDEIILSSSPVPRGLVNYTLTIEVTGNGQVHIDGGLYTEPITTTEGTTVSLNALADLGWLFESWSGDLESDDLETSLIMDGDKTIIATFTEIPAGKFTLAISSTGSGKVLVNGTEYKEALLIEEGTTVELKSIAGIGWGFESWSGDITSDKETIELIMADDTNVSVTFVPKLGDIVLLTGDQEDEIINYYDFVEWSLADAGKIAAWYHDFGDGKYTVLAQNPQTDTGNPSDKSVHIKTIAGPDWWGNFFNFRFREPIHITEHIRYLHILHYRENLNDGWSINLNVNEPLGDDAQGTRRFDGNNIMKGEWQDLVIDLKHLMDNNIPFTRFMTIVDKDWNGPRDNPSTGYYFDEIILSSDPTPRILPQITYTLTIEMIGNGTVKVNDQEYTVPVTVKKDSVLTISATPKNEWIFAGWSGSIITNEADTIVSMNGDKAITATFTSTVNVYNNLLPGIVSIYPNPFSDFINISYGGESTWLYISNITGQRVAETRLSGPQNTVIDTSGFKAGIYFLTLLKTDNSQEVHKILKY